MFYLRAWLVVAEISRLLSTEMHVFYGNTGTFVPDYLQSTASLLVPCTSVFLHIRSPV